MGLVVRVFGPLSKGMVRGQKTSLLPLGMSTQAYGRSEDLEVKLLRWLRLDVALGVLGSTAGTRSSPRPLAVQHLMRK